MLLGSASSSFLVYFSLHNNDVGLSLCVSLSGYVVLDAVRLGIYMGVTRAAWPFLLVARDHR